MKKNNHLFFILLMMFLIWMTGSFTACKNNSSANKQHKENTSKTNQTADKAALEPALSQCNKVEYMLYNQGISFESPNEGEVARFYAMLDNSLPDEASCPSNYDGGIVFKNEEGDIKMEMEFNILNGCNRVVYKNKWTTTKIAF